MALPLFTLVAPELRPAAFDDERFIFELKMTARAGSCTPARRLAWSRENSNPCR